MKAQLYVFHRLCEEAEEHGRIQKGDHTIRLLLHYTGQPNCEGALSEQSQHNTSLC